MKTFKILFTLISLLFAGIVGGKVGADQNLSAGLTFSLVLGIFGVSQLFSMPLKGVAFVGVLGCGISALYDSIGCNPDTNNSGAKDKLYFIPISYLDKSGTTFNLDNDLIIEALTLYTSSPTLHGFTITGKSLKVAGDHSGIQDGNGMSWLHGLKFQVQDSSPELSAKIEKMMKERFVILRINNYININNAINPGGSMISVLGYDLGLEFKAPKNTFTDPKLGNGWEFEMGCVEGQPEPRPQRFLFVDSPTASLAIAEGLVA